MDRYEEIMGAICQDDADRLVLANLVREFVQLEARLDYLRSLPQIKVHPDDPTRQRATPAAKQYKELLQQYTNIAKILSRRSGGDEQRGWHPRVGCSLRRRAARSDGYDAGAGSR